METDTPTTAADTRVVRWADGRCSLQVDGYEVPYLDVRLTHDQTVDDPPAAVSVIVQRPGAGPVFAFDTTEAELVAWAPLLAHAMAVSGGRTSHGANSLPLNPHGNSEGATK